MTPAPKPVRIKSKALTNSAKGRECTLRVSRQCTGGDAVFCHVRGPGDGMGTKPPDFWGYYGCHECHAMEERDGTLAWQVMRAIRETQTLMALDGLLIIKGWKND